MRYINTTTMKILEYSELRMLRQDISIPQAGTEKITIDGDEYCLINATPKPTGCFIESVDVVNIEGIYTEVYTTREYTNDELLIIKKTSTPQTITPRQIRQQLTKIGLRQQVEEYVASSSDYNLKDWWEYSTSFDRDNEVLISASTLLGLTDSQVDDLFIEASKL